VNTISISVLAVLYEILLFDVVVVLSLGIMVVDDVYLLNLVVVPSDGG